MTGKENIKPNNFLNINPNFKDQINLKDLSIKLINKTMTDFKRYVKTLLFYTGFLPENL